MSASITSRLRTFIKGSRTTESQVGLGGYHDRDDSLLFNEAVNFDLRTIFIAVPKTGTTSIRSQLAMPGKKLIPNPHLTLMQVRDGLYAYFLKQALGRNEHFPMDRTEVKSDAQIRAISQEVFETFFKFGSVRNPWARTVSLYFRREGVMVSDKLDFERFCDQIRFASDTCYHPTRVRNQVDWLTDENGKIAVDFVLKLEELDAGLKQIEDMTGGRLNLEVRDLNRNPKSGSGRYRELYTPQAKACIARVFEADIDHFGYTFD